MNFKFAKAFHLVLLICLFAKIVPCSFAQDSKFVPTLEAAKNELAVLENARWLIKKNTDPRQIVGRLNIFHRLHDKLSNKAKQQARYKADERWPDIYAKSVQPLLQEHEDIMKAELNEEEYKAYRSERMVFSLTNRSWYSLARFDSPLVIEQLGIDENQIKEIDRKTKSHKKDFSTLRQRDIQIRNEYVEDCLQILDRQQRKRLTDSDIDLKSIVNRQQTYSKREQDDDAPTWVGDAYWMKRMVTPYVMFPLGQKSTLPKLTRHQVAGLKEVSDALNEFFLFGEPMEEANGEMKLRTIESQMRKLLSEEEFEQILIAFLPDSYSSKVHPGIDFANYVSSTYLNLSDIQRKKMLAFRKHAAGQISKLRKEFCELQDKHVAVALSCLEREQVTLFRDWMGEDFKWKLNPDRTR